MKWSEEAVKRFPSLALCTGIIHDVKIERSAQTMEKQKESVLAKMRQNYTAEMLKDNTTVRAYRDLYWSLGIDPTKIRPSGEALSRRVLHGNQIPSISDVVDAYNLASLETIVPLSGFDEDLLAPPLEIRFSNKNDEFRGIGIDASVKLDDGKVLLLADSKQILCIYPHRDADATKITRKTRNVLIVAYGAPGISEAQLAAAVDKALKYIEIAAGGRGMTVKVFQSNPQS